MTFKELMLKHYGIWLYALFISFLWLLFINNGTISMENKKEAASLVAGFFATLAGVWGPLQIRGEQYTIQRGIERSRGYDDLDD
ncbi:hypothetical protein [Sulfurimonas sp. RIFOXYB12_FULL_35_9]|uniref:hypothetical protein n=1 Tax=Sulfurimonas sp. RIFOXYB12_FULL_35_9 TaxID=1802256 RepID=UPI0025D0913D|nr:hypothetical protein [Sulfurimonas sp. RIFOXYB12_FULL_35_9]